MYAEQYKVKRLDFSNNMDGLSVAVPEVLLESSFEENRSFVPHQGLEACVFLEHLEDYLSPYGQEAGSWYPPIAWVRQLLLTAQHH